MHRPSDSWLMSGVNANMILRIRPLMNVPGWSWEAANAGSVTQQKVLVTWFTSSALLFCGPTRVLYAISSNRLWTQTGRERSVADSNMHCCGGCAWSQPGGSAGGLLPVQSPEQMALLSLITDVLVIEVLPGHYKKEIQRFLLSLTALKCMLITRRNCGKH